MVSRLLNAGAAFAGSAFLGGTFLGLHGAIVCSLVAFFAVFLLSKNN